MIAAGEAFGRLVVVASGEIVNRRRRVPVRCVCGVEKIVDASNLKTGNTTSCGCLHREQLAARNYRHGLDVTDYRYNLWKSIRRRCYDPSVRSFRWYGARGIQVHEPWHEDFAAFAAYLDVHLGERPEDCSLDRIDNDGHYEPGNLRWATQAEQVANSRPWGTATPTRGGT